MSDVGNLEGRRPQSEDTYDQLDRAAFIHPLAPCNYLITGPG